MDNNMMPSLQFAYAKFGALLGATPPTEDDFRIQGAGQNLALIFAEKGCKMQEVYLVYNFIHLFLNTG